MKRIKTFEYFTYQAPEVDDITIEDLSEIIEEGERPYIVMIGEYSTKKNVTFMEADELTSLIFNEAKGSKKPIIILVDNFDSIPSELKTRCELIVTDDELSDVAKMKSIVYSL